MKVRYQNFKLKLIMEVNYLSICIKGAEKGVVEGSVATIPPIIRHFLTQLGVRVEFRDLTEEYAAMGEFLADNDLQDENPFFNDFNLDAFGLQIDFDFLRDFKYLDFLEMIVFLIAKHISEDLKTKCVLMFSNLRVPVSLFDNGFVIDDFKGYNKDFFRKKDWYPQINSQK